MEGEVSDVSPLAGTASEIELHAIKEDADGPIHIRVAFTGVASQVREAMAGLLGHVR